MAGKAAPLRRRLSTITMASAGSALLLTCGGFVAHQVFAFREGMVRGLSSQAQVLARQSTSAVVFRDPESAGGTLAALSTLPHVLAAALYLPDGSPFATYRRAEGLPVPPPLGAGHPPHGHAFTQGRLVVHRDLSFDGATIGTLVIESDFSEVWDRLREYAAIALAVMLASFVLARWIASRMQRAITGPVLHLAETAQAVSSRNDYAVRAVPQGDAELAFLMETFNRMLDQLQDRDAALHVARDGLERQVDARTRELQREIADRKLLEDELRRKNEILEEQSRRVQEATRLKSEFLANMSHELRTPLNAVVGFAELLHDAKVGPVSAQQKDCLADILTSSRHLLQLINDVLDLSKVEAGKMEFRPEPVSLPRVIEEVRDIVRGLTARKRILVTAELDPGVAEVVLDPGKLKQVLYNYLSNALKFTPEGGRVTVRTRAEGEGHFRVEVEDSGTGIRPEDMPRLFVEFQQLDASAAKAHPGTGLGLALTKRIVEAQAGRVGVESVFGQGSVFFAVLPRVAAGRDLSRFAAWTPPAAARGAATVLVVEDDTNDRQWLVRTLAGAGYAVQVAGTGGEALARCRERRFDAITLDLLLSDMTGWDVLRGIRSGGANEATPVVVVTVVAETGSGAGFAIHDHLTKPVASAALLASLERAGLLPGACRPILVVDDDAQACRLAATTLEALGYRSLTAGDGVEGLRVASAESVAAVILDLLMPELDGFEFLERFRARAGPSIPVIVWTAKDLSADDYDRLVRSVHAVVLKSEGGAGRLIDELRAWIPLPQGGGGRALPPSTAEGGTSPGSH